MACVFLVGYLQVANALYMFKKFNSLFKQVRWNRSIKCAKTLLHISRTLYLTFGGALIVLKFWVQDTSLEGYFESIKKFECESYRYLSIFVQYEVIQVSRLLFAFSQMYHTRIMLGKSFGKKNTIFLGMLLCSTCAIIFQTDMINGGYETEYKGHPICILPVKMPILIMWVFITSVFEMVMLILYIYPLWKLDLSNDRSIPNVLTCIQKDLRQSHFTGEATYSGGGSTSKREKNYTLEEEGCISDLILSYHQCVIRNSYSGVLGIVLYFQFIIVFLSFYGNQELMKRYWFSGAGLIHFSVTFFTIYICIVLTDRDWLLNLLPCICRIAEPKKPSEMELG